MSSKPERVAQVLCVGMCALDTIYQVESIPITPTKILATGYTECGGGMAANASVAVARLGGAAHYWGRVGDDALGTRICAELAAEGVNVSAVRRIADCVSPSAAILVAADGERLVCAYNDAALDHNADWIPLPMIAALDAVLVDVRWPEASQRVLDAARAADIPAVLDGDVGPIEVLHDLAQRATHAIFSEPGLARLHPAGDAAARLRAVATRYPNAVVGVTLGPLGAQWIERGAIHHAPAPAVIAVDTLAAGDVFHGAFTLALAEGASTRDAANFANTAAAIKCSRFGGRRGAPTRAEVVAALRGGGDRNAKRRHR